MNLKNIFHDIADFDHNVNDRGITENVSYQSLL